MTSNSWSLPQFPSSRNYRHAPPCLFRLYKWYMGMEPGSICPSWLAYSLVIPVPLCSSLLFHTPECLPSQRWVTFLCGSVPVTPHLHTHLLMDMQSLLLLCGGNENNCKKIFPCICFESLGPVLGSEIGMCHVNLLKLYLCTAKFIIAPKILDKVLETCLVIIRQMRLKPPSLPISPPLFPCPPPFSPPLPPSFSFSFSLPHFPPFQLVVRLS